MSTIKEQLQKNGVFILDVRGKDEFASGNPYSGAVNIPVAEVAARVNELGEDKSRPVLIYCAKGGRAATAADVLKQHGFTDVLSAANADALRSAH
jgi:phage shock protein E